ncbi:MAG: ROK family protein [Sporolactobacillus sp.]
MNTYLVFDIGGTNVKYAQMTDSGVIIKKNSVPTPTDTLTHFLLVIEQVIDQYIDEIKGIAISVPGRVDPADDRIYFGGSLPFLNGISFSESLPTCLPITVENDGKAATLAELWRGSLVDVDSGAVVVLGTAVGGGIVINHRLIRGRHDQAAEFSFMKEASADSMTSLFGHRASAVRMIKTISKQIGLSSTIDGKKVFKAITDQNPTALAIFTEFCHSIANLIYNIQIVLDAERYVISGGISLQPQVTLTINQQFDKIRSSNPLIMNTLARPEIVTSKFRNDANLYGALYQMIYKQQQGTT